MRSLFTFLICLTLAAPGFGAPAADPPVTKTIRVCILNVEEAVGMIWVGIYTGEENFLIKEKARLIGIEVTATGAAYIDLPGMEMNKEYALAIFHDVDNDGDMNRNWLGMPSEPWAFSGPAVTRLRVPTFSETKFRVTEELDVTTLRLRMI